MKPLRIQLRRVKGWKMPPNTVCVSRPSIWGNRFRVREADGDPAYGIVIPAITPAQAVELYRADIADRWLRSEALFEPLRAKNHACWCKLCPAHADGKPWDVRCEVCCRCHADVTLEFSNLDRPALVKRLLECTRAA